MTRIPEQVMSAQQYNLTMKGHPALLDWIKEHVQQLHAPPAGHDSILTGGTNYSLEVTIIENSSCLQTVTVADPPAVKHLTIVHGTQVL